MVDKRMKEKKENRQKPVNWEMDGQETNKALVKKIKALTKKLENARLRAAMLETLIVVAEEELEVKIRTMIIDTKKKAPKGALFFRFRSFFERWDFLPFIGINQAAIHAFSIPAKRNTMIHNYKSFLDQTGTPVEIIYVGFS